MNTLKNHLHELVDGENGSAPPIDRLIQRGRRARRRRHATTLALSVLVVGVLGVAAAIQPQMFSDAPQAEAQADPRMELVAALANSEKTSFKVRAAITERRSTYILEGAFDPATTTGYLQIERIPFEVRLIEGVKYMTKGDDAWVQSKGRDDTLGYDSKVLGGELNGSTDSERLFDVLRRADAVITKTGERSYHYEVLSREPKAAGDVVLDGDRRVSKMTCELRFNDLAVGSTVTIATTLEFWDYGTPVRVERPANAVKAG